MKKLVFFVFAFMGLFTVVGQEISLYKYIIVPQEYEFLKEPNQYELNALTQFLFEKKGYIAVMEEDSFPEDLNSNGCNALVANVKSNSGIFSTKLLVTAKDCNGREIFVSEEGKSRAKDFKVAFHDALRNAFETVPERNEQAEVAGVVAKPEGNRAGSEPMEESVVVGRPEIDTIGKERSIKGEVVENPSDERRTIKSATSSVEKNTTRYTKDNGVFILEKTPKGYDLYQEGMAEPFAALIQSSAGNSFIYSAINSKGMAQFDAQGNLVIEILNSETDSLDSMVYKLQN